MTTYACKIIEDSIGHHNRRLTTFQLTYPRYVHAELMTHRMFSRSAASSRAIPVNKLAQAALENMVQPIRWGKNQAGMQAAMEDLSAEDLEAAKVIWENVAKTCAEAATNLAKLGLHKQWANRMLEWFGTITVVVTATDYDNFFELRCHPDAQPEINHLANLMRLAYGLSKPRVLVNGEWHLPYVSGDERCYEKDSYTLAKISSARCARVSYLKHDGTAPSVSEDLALFDRLAGSRPAHLSPLEHAAECWGDANYYFNLCGFRSFRWHYEPKLQNLNARA